MRDHVASLANEIVRYVRSSLVVGLNQTNDAGTD